MSTKRPIVGDWFRPKQEYLDRDQVVAVLSRPLITSESHCIVAAIDDEFIELWSGFEKDHGPIYCFAVSTKDFAEYFLEYQPTGKEIHRARVAASWEPEI
ncbi:MAG: hypothetical protein IKD52_10095 [Exiguobacterium sp.]|nr:hypothetical protein [Exiguobacterium sp.]